MKSTGPMVRLTLGTGQSCHGALVGHRVAVFNCQQTTLEEESMDY